MPIRWLDCVDDRIRANLCYCLACGEQIWFRPEEPVQLCHWCRRRLRTGPDRLNLPAWAEAILSPAPSAPSILEAKG